MADRNDRITVALTSDAMAKLRRLVSRTGRNQTEVVNKALGIMEYIEGETRKGRKLIIRDARGREEEVKLL